MLVYSEIILDNLFFPRGLLKDGGSVTFQYEQKGDYQFYCKSYNSLNLYSSRSAQIDVHTVSLT